MKGIVNPRDSQTWLFDVEVYLTQIASGKTVIIKDQVHGWGEDEPSSYTWSEGNCSCDCNRSLIFYRAIGHTDEEIDAQNLESKCGEQDYRVDKIVCQGEEFYSEVKKCQK